MVVKNTLAAHQTQVAIIATAKVDKVRRNIVEHIVIHIEPVRECAAALID